MNRQEETGWLIETKSGNSVLCYSGDSCYTWSTPDRAIRFARRSDAERMIRILFSEEMAEQCYPAEHIWFLQ